LYELKRSLQRYAYADDALTDFFFYLAIIHVSCHMKTTDCHWLVY